MDLGLVLRGQPIGILANLTIEYEEATRHVEMEVDATEEVEHIGTTNEAEVQVDASQGEEMEIGGVRKTLSEVLPEAEPSFTASRAVMTGP